jgi:hypothetical protein
VELAAREVENVQPSSGFYFGSANNVEDQPSEVSIAFMFSPVTG